MPKNIRASSPKAYFQLSLRDGFRIIVEIEFDYETVPLWRGLGGGVICNFSSALRAPPCLPIRLAREEDKCEATIQLGLRIMLWSKQPKYDFFKLAFEYPLAY